MTDSRITRQDVLDAIESEIRTVMRNDAWNGANGYRYVKVQPDGVTVYSGLEPSYCQTIDEWEGKAPHTVTVWSCSQMESPAGKDDGVFCWEEVAESKPWAEDCGRVYLVDSDGDQGEQLDGVFADGGKLYRLINELVEEFDLTELMEKIDAELNAFDWIPAE
jgi:hypothetical protein